MPIGDRYTMGATSARVQALFQVRDHRALPLRNFPELDQTADKFVDEMGQTPVLVPKVGVPFEV